MIKPKYFSLIMQARNLADIMVAITEAANGSETANTAACLLLQDAERALDKSYEVLSRIRAFQRKAIVDKR